MARPQKDKLEARSAHLPPVRLTEAELARVVELAADAGLTVSEFARQRIFTGRTIPRPALPEAQLLSELNRCGVNLNMIARALNAGRGLPTSADSTLAAFRLVRSVIKGETDDPAEIAAGLFIIVYRLRNNLHHGLKWVYDFKDQKPNFRQAAKALMAIMDMWGIRHRG